VMGKYAGFCADHMAQLDEIPNIGVLQGTKFGNIYASEPGVAAFYANLLEHKTPLDNARKQFSKLKEGMRSLWLAR
jgi:hypothetical protein